MPMEQNAEMHAVVEHCDVGAHCSYSWDRRCICLCAKCKDAKEKDRRTP